MSGGGGNHDGPCSGAQEVAGSAGRWRASVRPIGRGWEKLSRRYDHDVDHVQKRWGRISALRCCDVCEFGIIGGKELKYLCQLKVWVDIREQPEGPGMAMFSVCEQWGQTAH